MKRLLFLIATFLVVANADINRTDHNLSVDDIIVIYKQTLTAEQLEKLEKLLAEFEDKREEK